MLIGSTLQAVLRLARVALATILLVGVPLAEAATCGAEALPTAHQSVAVADADVATADNANQSTDHDKQPGEAPHCIHGHCHHGLSWKNVDGASDVVLTAEANQVSQEPGFILVRVITGLERPPKA